MENKSTYKGQNGLLHVAIGANRMVESIFLHPVSYNSGFSHLIQVSRQAFPRKIGQKVRWVSKTHGYHNVTYATAMSYMHAAYMESWF